MTMTTTRMMEFAKPQVGKPNKVVELFAFTGGKEVCCAGDGKTKVGAEFGRPESRIFWARGVELFLRASLGQGLSTASTR